MSTSMRMTTTGPCAFLLVGLIATLFACTASAPRAGKTPPIQPPTSPNEVADASFDWRVLLPASFGSALKNIPLALHEVLLFRDEAGNSARADEPECYASDVPAPRFVARTPEEYVLCFKQDRLVDVQASVRLPAADAPQVFALACERWSKSIAVPPTSAARQDPLECAGRDGDVHFVGRLEEGQESTERKLSIILDSSPEPP
jgi:hypothetical protein